MHDGRARARFVQHRVSTSDPPASRQYARLDRRTSAGKARAVLTAIRNLLDYHILGKKDLSPLYVVWYATLRCNLACSFCDDGTGKKYPDVRYPELKTAEALRLLELIREACGSIYFTGGEPFVRRDMPVLLRRSRELGFWPLFVNTNLSLANLPDTTINDIDVLVVSLGATDCENYDRVLQSRPGQTRIILDNLKRYATWQARGGPRIVVNCVISAHRMADARAVFAFCQDHDLYFSPVAEQRGAYIDPRLFTDPDYEPLVDEVLAAKETGKLVYGSRRGLEILLRGRRFRCYPTLAPHIYPNGDLWYPCHPLRNHAVNILEHGSFAKAWQLCSKHYAPMPACDNRCHLACYVNNSQWMEHPLEMVWENSRVAGHAAERRGSLQRVRSVPGDAHEGSGQGDQGAA